MVVLNLPILIGYITIIIRFVIINPFTAMMSLESDQ